MRIDMIAFTERGVETGRRLADDLAARHIVRLTRCGEEHSLGEWTAEAFARADALVFVGAAGIAVRAIAPHIASKLRDPAVVAVDDTGRYAVALLSGHIGGANSLVKRIADVIGAEAVITTATDRNGVFAVDAWARERGYRLGNPDAVKTVSAKLLAGAPVRIRCSLPVSGSLPSGCVTTEGDADVVIGIDATPSGAALRVIPPVAFLGIGCRKGIGRRTLDAFFEQVCGAAGILPEAFAGACSIDIKRGEPGLVEFCRARGLRYVVFTADELRAQPGEFSSSAFVMKTTGVDNVCERSAVAGSGGGRLVVRKMVGRGVAMAAAIGEWVVDFGDGDGVF